MKVGTTLLGIIAGLSFLVVSASPSPAETFHSNSGGYQFELPDGWEPLPDELLKEIGRANSEKTGVQMAYDAAFRLPLPGFGGQPPCVMVQLIPYCVFGVEGQLHEDSFPEVVRGLTGLKTEEARTQMTEKARQVLDEIKFSRPVLDMPNRRFVWEMSTGLELADPIRGIAVGHFGREGIVQVILHSPRSQWDQYAEARKLIASSFRFDPDKAYDEQLAKESRVTFWRTDSMRDLTRIVVGVLGVAVVVAGIFRRRRKSKPARETDPPQ
jgi:hypothetical protein